jgi:integrase
MAGCRALTQEEIIAVMRSFKGPQKTRNTAMFQFLLKTGFRISEALSLRLKDFIKKNGKFFTDVTVERKHMKSNKKKTHTSRTVPLHPDLVEYLRKWFEQMREYGFCQQDSYVFCTAAGEPLNRRYTLQLWKKHFLLCGMSGKLGNHSMRKTYGEKCLARATVKYGNDRDYSSVLQIVQHAMGHKNINSTMSYLDIGKQKVDNIIMEMWD